MAKLWRVKRRGKYIGSWRVTIKGREINLQTQDANEARRRAALAAKGQWPQEETAAASASAAFEVSKDPQSPESVGVPHEPSGAGDASGDQAVNMPSQAPLIPDVTPSENWAADAGAAAAEGSPHDPGAAAADSATLDPGVLDGLISNAAVMLVELQLTVQGAAIRRFAKKEPAPVPDDFILRAPAAKMWEAQLRIWLPKDLPLPPWGAALLLVGVMGTMQYAAARPLDDVARGT